jgi:hypothetical protein
MDFLLFLGLTLGWQRKGRPRQQSFGELTGDLPLSLLLAPLLPIVDLRKFYRALGKAGAFASRAFIFDKRFILWIGAANDAIVYFEAASSVTPFTFCRGHRRDPQLFISSAGTRVAPHSLSHFFPQSGHDVLE